MHLKDLNWVKPFNMLKISTDHFDSCCTSFQWNSAKNPKKNGFTIFIQQMKCLFYFSTTTNENREGKRCSCHDYSLFTVELSEKSEKSKRKRKQHVFLHNGEDRKCLSEMKWLQDTFLFWFQWIHLVIFFFLLFPHKFSMVNNKCRFMFNQVCGWYSK